MKKLCLIICVLISAFPVVAAAFEAPFPPPADCRQVKMAGDLNLTAEQEAKLHELRLEFLKTSKPAMDRLMARHGDLALLWMETNPDAGKITAVQKEISGLEDTIAGMELEHRFAVLKVLTPGQQMILRVHFSHHPVFPPPPPGRGCIPPTPFAPPCHGAF